jgi:large subunit ribosomal protein L19
MISADVITDQYKKRAIPQVKSGDTVRVHQRIREGSKQRVQVFEGVVIRSDRMNELTARITVRRIASGVGVEKSFLLHSPNVSRIDITRRSKVRRNYLSYLRERRGKGARLAESEFDRAAVNAHAEVPDEAKAVSDADITELDAEEMEDEQEEVVASTDDVAAAENKEAAKADPNKDPDAADDEALLEAAEVKQGVDAAEAKE